MRRNEVKFETEAKIRVERFNEIEERLQQSGAVYKEAVRETDTYFKDPEGRLLASGSGLRLRRQVSQKGEKALLTFKGPVRQGPYKSRPEAQTWVSDYEEMSRILASLDYSPAIVVEKDRQLWQLGVCEVCLDTVENLGTFVEVEGPGEQEITRVLKTLGLDSQPHLHSGYAQMLSEWLQKEAGQSADKQE